MSPICAPLPLGAFFSQPGGRVWHLSEARLPILLCQISLPTVFDSFQQHSTASTLYDIFRLAEMAITVAEILECAGAAALVAGHLQRFPGESLTTWSYAHVDVSISISSATDRTPGLCVTPGRLFGWT